MSPSLPSSTPVRQRGVFAPPKGLDARELLFRAVIVLVILGSLALAWWTYTRVFTPLQKQSRELTSTLGQLSASVENLERKWTRADVEQIRANCGQAYLQLFPNKAALEAWLDHLQEQAAPLALDVKVDIGKIRPRNDDEDIIAVIPTSVSLEVRPVAAGGESPYQRVLRLGQQLAAEGKRADLAELHVAGGTESVSRALLVFNLWAGEDGNR